MNDLAEGGIYAIESSYLERYVQLGIASGRVVSVSFPDHPAETAQLLERDSVGDPDDETPDHPVIDRLFEYLDGVSEVSFTDIEIALTVPTVERAVLEQVRTIPYGESVDVKTIVSMTPELDDDEQSAAIQVRTALDENPIPIVIPDHRVRDGPSAAPPAVEQKLRSLEGL